MKYAVTAASGRLGRAILSELIEKVGKENVIGIARKPASLRELGIEVRQGDYNSVAEMKEALKGVYSFVLISSDDEPKKRIQQHKNVLLAAYRAGVKKVSYTSIVGEDPKSEFRHIIKSNRTTEVDVKESGLRWMIGRNGLYIDPDVDSIEYYHESGFISNSAPNGKCAYTSRLELAVAYAEMATNEDMNFQTYDLTGPSISQVQLAKIINHILETEIEYKSIPASDFKMICISNHGETLGEIIAAIYEEIEEGTFDVPSQFEAVVGRAHKTPPYMIIDLLKGLNIKDKDEES